MRTYGWLSTVVSPNCNIWPLGRFAISNNNRFLPVYRGCVALAYPNRWRGGLDPDTQDVPLNMEWVPADPATRAALDTRHGLVHFDLDIQNTMLGGFDDGHALTPKFKVLYYCSDP